MKSSFTLEEMLLIYKDMLLLRRFEEKTGQLYGMGLIGGFCHLYIGQEGVAIGIVKAINSTDTIITSYRDHGFMLASGASPKHVMAELLGKETGCSRGKGGSMHMFNIKKGFYGGHGIVGAQVSMGTGIGFAHKYKNNDSISITIFGDGACHQGQVYESFNIAKLWGLPVLYIIENNEYAMGTSVERSSSTKDLYKRGESFGIDGKQIDGMNFFKVYESVKSALKYIRENKTPFILECKTYRYRGHSMSDPARYRTKCELEDYKNHHDPIVSLKSFIIQNNEKVSKQLQQIEQDVKKIVTESVEYAQNSSQPSPQQLYTNVYR